MSMKDKIIESIKTGQSIQWLPTSDEMRLRTELVLELAEENESLRNFVRDVAGEYIDMYDAPEKARQLLEEIGH